MFQMFHARLIAALLLLLWTGIADAERVPQAPQLTQYRHLSWRVQDGVFAGTPNALAQTPDGYMWIGTSGGLVRFDGIRFVPFPELDQVDVETLHAGRDGTLWIGTDHGVVSLRGGRLQQYPAATGWVNGMAEDADGDLWYTRSRVDLDEGALCTIRATKVECFGTETGLSPIQAGAMTIDRAGDIWLEQPNILRRWNGTVKENFNPENWVRLHPAFTVAALVPESDGSLLVGSLVGGLTGGLQRLRDGVLTPAEVPGLDGSQLSVTALMADADRSLWIGTDGQGLIHVHDGRADRFLEADGLTGSRVTSIFRDADGSVWIATNRGIDCFVRVPVLSYSVREGLASGSAFSVAAARDGGVWVGGAGLNLLQGSRHDAVTRGHGFPGARAASLLDTGSGPLWVGIDSELFAYSSGRFTLVAHQPFDDTNTLLGIAQDPRGELFALRTGRPSRLYRVDVDKLTMSEVALPPAIDPRAIAVNPRGGLLVATQHSVFGWHQDKWETLVAQTSALIMHLAADGEGAIWGATSNGLFRWKDGQERVLDNHDGLGCSAVYAVIPDRDGNVWAYASCGLMRMAKSDIDEWWSHPGSAIKTRLFDAFDGASPAEASFDSVAASSSDGRLWFVNRDVAQSIDPARLPDPDLVLPIKIEDMLADHAAVALDVPIRIAALTRSYQFRYTAASPSNAQRLKFRYRLEGLESDWQEAGNRREAFYNDLPPGKYRFHVSGRRSDGAWSTNDSVLDFVVLPAWYQTAGFRVAAALAVALSAWLFLASRMRKIRRDAEARYDLRMAERTRLARDLHDTLLQTIQASKMVADVALDTPNEPELQRRAVEDVANWLNQALQEGRAALASLRLLGESSSDLALALTNEVARCNAVGPLRANLTSEGEPWPLHPIAQEETFRIGAEAIANACKHSGGTQVDVILRYDAVRLELRVIDDGRGIDAHSLDAVSQGHFGILGMRERATQIGATLHIGAGAGGGVQVTLLLPRHRGGATRRIWHWRRAVKKPS